VGVAAVLRLLQLLLLSEKGHCSLQLVFRLQQSLLETHLSELLEEVCNSMNDYALHVDPDTQHKQYRRFAPRSGGAPGDFPDFNHFQFDGPDASNALKFACETLVDDLEDEIILLFRRDTEHVSEELCSRVSDYCKDSSHTNEEL
ncbi:hypothetical protein JOQ06_001168, partial [Pogonophryne albipinna]